MELLKDLYIKSPSTSSINLEFSEIEDLSPLLPILSKFSNLEELILFGNRLEVLPRDLSGLKQLKKFDISNNMIQSIVQAISSLKTLPRLMELTITTATQDEEELILNSLPNLLKLNDNESAGQETAEFQGPESLTQDDLEKVAMMYDDIRNCAKEIDPTLDKKLAVDFDEIVKKIMTELSEVLKTETSGFLTHTHMILAKFNMYRVCQEKAALLISRSNKKLGLIVKELSEAHKTVFEQIGKIIFEANLKLNEKSQTASKEVNRLTSQISNLLNSIEGLKDDIENMKREHKIQIESLQEEREETMKELESLQEENKKYLDTIIKHSKGSTGNLLNITAYEEKPKLISQSLTTRTLSLKQLKDVISEIYDSKAKFDEKCAENKMPRETMEQHMYSFLNQKYGLRSLIIEWVAAIITGIKTYSGEDNDVAVFGKILRNECDEEFRFVQNQVRETVLELLKIQVKNKFPLKLANELQKIVDEKIQTCILEDEWNEIVKYMYNEADSHVLLNQIWQTIQVKSQPTNSKSRSSREDLQKKDPKNASISYNDFLKTLLDFQLKAHEKFLAPFIKLFRSIGTNKNGVLNEGEFVALCKLLDINETEVPKLLSIIDPYENQNVTFSECVALFSTELSPNKTIPILQELGLNAS